MPPPPTPTTLNNIICLDLVWLSPALISKQDNYPPPPMTAWPDSQRSHCITTKKTPSAPSWNSQDVSTVASSSRRSIPLFRISVTSLRYGGVLMFGPWYPQHILNRCIRFSKFLIVGGSDLFFNDLLGPERFSSDSPCPADHFVCPSTRYDGVWHQFW